MTPKRPRAPRTALLAACVGVLVVGFLAWRGPRLRTDVDRAVLAGLAMLPPRATCGDRLGEWAALARGVVPDDARPCFGELVAGPHRRRLLVRIAREPGRSERARAGAFEALAAGRHAPEELALDLLLSPRTPATRRHAALAALARRPDGPRWADIAADVPVHGLADRGTLLLAAAGEEGRDRAIARAAIVTARFDAGRAERSLLAFWGLDEATVRSPAAWTRLAEGEAQTFERWGCGVDCVEPLVRLLDARELARGIDDPPAAPEWPAEFALLDALAGDGERADAVRERAYALAAWVGVAGEAERASRLAAALAQPGGSVGERRRVGAGDPGAVLDAGAGTAAVQALLLRAVGELAETPVILRRGLREPGAWSAGPMLGWIDGAAGAVRLGGCGGVVASADWAAARPVRAGELEAEAVEDAAGAALRRGDLEMFLALAAAAGRFAGEEPADRVLAVGLALRGEAPLGETEGRAAGADPAVAVVEPDDGPPARFAPWVVPPPPVRKGRRRPALEPPAAPTAGELDQGTARLATRIVDLGGVDGALAAAWWAERAGHPDLARWILARAAPAPRRADAAASALRQILAARLEEPGVEVARETTTPPGARRDPGCAVRPALWPDAPA